MVGDCDILSSEKFQTTLVSTKKVFSNRYMHIYSILW